MVLCSPYTLGVLLRQEPSTLAERSVIERTVKDSLVAPLAAMYGSLDYCAERQPIDPSPASDFTWTVFDMKRPALGAEGERRALVDGKYNPWPQFLAVVPAKNQLLC